MSIDAIETKLKARLAEFGTMRAKFKFSFSEGGCLHVDATKTPPVMTRADEAADCVILISTDNMLKLMDGALNPTLAFTMGKLKIKGSMGLAMKLSALLED